MSMTHDAGPTTLTADELAALAGCPPERIAALADLGILGPRDDGSFAAGDLHVLRLVDAFEASGVPLDALLAGRLDFAAYHDLHRDPGPPSERSYGETRAALDPEGTRLTALFTAFGLAQPAPEVRLAAADEARLVTWLERLASVSDPDLLIRVIRLHGESARRTAAAALDVYAEAAERLGPDPASVDPDAYARLLEPWARIARELPDVAGWLAERHLRDAIDAFSVETSEQLLAAEVDLTGYTRTTQELGDETAAARSLRLGELARSEAEPRGGRLVKLLGDGALLQLPSGVAAVECALGLCRAIVDAGLGGGHAGVSAGPVIEREGDVYGRTVNLAARISDHAVDGTVEIGPELVADLTAAGFTCRSRGPIDLQGIGPVELFVVEAGR
jgi:adenylate cyclase